LWEIDNAFLERGGRNIDGQTSPQHCPMRLGQAEEGFMPGHCPRHGTPGMFLG